MAFVPKEWKDRLVEFAGRRKLTNVSTGEEMIVDVVRNEGAVSQEGDAFSAANMSDLEQRVADEFNNINTNLENIYTLDWGNAIDITTPFTPYKNGVIIISGSYNEYSGYISVTDETHNIRLFASPNNDFRGAEAGTQLLVNKGITYSLYNYPDGSFNFTTKKFVPFK